MQQVFKKKIAILAGYSMSPNMLAELLNFGKMLSGGFELHLLTGPEKIPQSLTPYYKVFRYKKYVPIDPAKIFYALSLCKNYLRNINPDVIINIAKPSLAFAASVMGRYYQIPSIVRMVGDTYHESSIGNTAWKKMKNKIIHGFISNFSYKNSTAIITLGDNLKSKLIEHNHNPQKITVLPQPFDDRCFKPLSVSKKQEKKLNLRLEQNKKIILFVGRISWLKGADRLKKIIENVLQISDSFQFCIVGEGDMVYSFRMFPENSVKIVGNVPHEKIVQYYQTADLFLFPSRAEGLPNVILEALSCRVPIIASPIAEIPLYVSRTAEEPEEYVNYIFSEQWKVDPLPDWFGWSKQKQAYLSFFENIIFQYQNN